MPVFFPKTDLRQEQAEAMARGLFAVARADGLVHERETALIGEFFAATSALAANLGALERAPQIDAETLGVLLPTPELGQLFIKTALLLAYTDNNKAPAEARIIGEYATALGISESQLSVFETQVKEFMLAQLTHLANVEAAAAVAAELKV